MSFGERLFSLLLLAYPASFRRRYRADLLAFFRADREDPSHGPGVRGLRVSGSGHSAIFSGLHLRSALLLFVACLVANHLQRFHLEICEP